MDKIKIQQIDPLSFSTQNYKAEDTELVSSFSIKNIFNPLNINNHIEYHIYDINNNLLTSNYRLEKYSVENASSKNSINNISSIVLNPINNIKDLGFEEGIYNTYYNFFQNHLGSSSTQKFFIKEISSDRTELRISSNQISNDLIKEQINSFIELLNSKDYFGDFLLNFGNNKTIIAVNIILDGDDILIKLYEPLPINFGLKSLFWIVEKISEPLAYNIEFPTNIIEIDNSIKLKGPNLNIPINDNVNNSSDYIDLSSIILNNITSSYNQLNSIFEEKNIEINIDYTKYENFVHFSNAERRINNFFYKIQEIETIDSNIYQLINTNSSSLTSNNIIVEESKKNNIIENFDGYEYFLYYETGSLSFPKISPSVLYNTTSSEAQTWITSSLEKAIIYDENNKDLLSNSIPKYIRENSDNILYSVYVDMIAHHFDNIWVYIKDITNKYDTDNRIDFGVSKDLVSQILKDFGLKIYQNNFSDNDLATAFLGISGSLPNTSNTLPITKQGVEYIDTFISSSKNIPFDDINKRLYKRLYHNLPLLFKQKGTISGLRSLISSYGIPNTILDIKEFGFKSYSDNNEYKKEIFNYSFYTSGSGFVNIPFEDPKSFMFRFKLDPIPSGTLPPLNQNLLNIDNDFLISINYTGSGLIPTDSYSGSIIDPDYEYGFITLNSISDGLSSSIYVPIYNDEWWSININKTQSGSNYIYDLNLCNKGEIYSSSLITTNDWSGNNNLYVGSSGSFTINNETYTSVSSSFQEFRYYNSEVSNYILKQYNYNPFSILNTNNITFRGAFGSVLDLNYTSSIHSNITGSFTPVESFITGNSNFTYNGSYSFKQNNEFIFINEPTIGLKNIITEQIKIDNITSSISYPEVNIPTDKVLSPYVRINKNKEEYTNTNEYLEVGFSPQNEINSDIVSQLGVFDLATYIGDPSILYIKDRKYPQLELLQKEYLSKYLSKFGLFDYIRLIKYFDNSLFKLLKDFIPAKSDPATGVIIKSSILDRNKITTSLPIVTDELRNFSIRSGESIIDGQKVFTTSSIIPIPNFSGSNALDLEHNQSWEINIPTTNGETTKIIDDSNEFLTGEYSGSNILVTNGKLNNCNTQLVLKYSTPTLGTTNPIVNPGPGPELIIPYNFQNNKVYYINFGWDNLEWGLSFSLLDNNNNIYSTIINNDIGGPDSGNINHLIVKNPTYPLGFKSVFNIDIKNVEVYEVGIDPDCLVLDNNILKNRSSNNKQLVNYTNQIDSSNFNQLLSGSATKYEIQDSNYSLTRHINPRYNGSKNLGTNIKYPAREEYTNYFAYFDWIGGASPQVPGGGNIHIIYLIDKEGNKTSLNPSNKNLWNIENIFSPGTSVNLFPIDGDFEEFGEVEDIIFGGRLLQTIMYIETGSSYPIDIGMSVDIGSGSYQSTQANAWFTPSGSNLLIDNPSGSIGSSIYILQNNRINSILYPIYGDVDYYYNDDQIKFWDVSNRTFDTIYIPSEDTYLPLRSGDFIRFGNSSLDTPNGLDVSFESAAFFVIKNIITGSNSDESSSLEVEPDPFSYPFIVSGGLDDSTTQRYRIMRPIPNETFILIRNRPFSGKGFAIPENYNPNLNWEKLATIAGLL